MKNVWLKRMIVPVIFMMGIGGAAGYLLATENGAVFLLTQISDHYAGPGNYSWSRLQGTLWKGLAARDLEIRDIPGMEQESVLRIQELSLSVSMSGVPGLEAEFHNARLLSPHDDPLVFEGRWHDGQISGNIYARGLNLLRIRDIFPAFRRLSVIRGSLKDIDLVLTGDPDDLRLQGRLWVDQWRYASYLLEDCEVEPDLKVSRSGGEWQVNGRIMIVAGDFLTPRVKIRLAAGRIDLYGDPARPSFDIRGYTRVARTQITIVIRGTREEPQVILSSEPPLPQEQLLLMLTTGKKWKSIAQPSFQRGMTTEVAADFVDYFIFGGSGRRLSQYLGLSDLSVTLDERSRGVTVSKDVTERLGIGYGVQMETPPDEPAIFRQKMTGEYDVTGRVTVGVQKEIAAPADPKVTDPVADQPIDDRVYMKYRAAF